MRFPGDFGALRGAGVGGGVPIVEPDVFRIASQKPAAKTAPATSARAAGTCQSQKREKRIGPDDTFRAGETTTEEGRAGAADVPIVLSARGLTKRFGRREVVSDVSFDLAAGEVFGFLGPNGAGKTTTIRMLVGLARPDSGRVSIAGFDLHRDFSKAMSHVGCIVESTDLYPYLTGRENLVHFARMLPDGAEKRIPELARLVFLEGRLDDRVATYSLGMRQRLGLAQALLGEPDLLILDEPANGLDPAGIREIRELVRHLAHDRGIAIFISSHLLSEVEQTCDRVAIIHRGRTLAMGPVQELLESRGAERLVFRASPAGGAEEILAPFGRTGAKRVEGEEAVASDVPRERVPEALAALAAAGVLVYGVERHSSTLEEIFLEVTGGETV
jgi:ABC-2 type transport system ATP-binding protein